MTGFWLHADDRHDYERKESVVDHDLGEEFAGLSERVAKIEWDGAPLRSLCITEERLFDDAFILQHVPAEQVYNVNFVNGVIPVLREYIHGRRTKEERESALVPLQRRAVGALQELRQFFFSRGQEVKTRQKMLRCLKVVEVLVDVLKAPFAKDSAYPITLDDLGNPNVRTDKSQLVCDEAAAVLQAYLEGNSRKNELYIARHLPFFQYLFGTQISMEAMYTELVRDNLKIVDCITSQEINRVIDLLASGDKNHNYLNFLGVLCECEEQPIPENQNEVAHRLLKEHDGIVFLTEFKHFTDPDGRLVEPGVKGAYEEMAVSTDGGVKWCRLREFVETAMDEDDTTSSPEYLFLQGQLDLFGVLCNGRNAKNIVLITEDKGYLTWRECFNSVQDRGLPWSLRSKYVELMTYLFVDVGDNIDVLSEIQLSFGWNELLATGGEPYHDAADDPTTSLSGAKLPFFEPLSQWIQGVLRSLDGKMIAQDLPLNLFLVEVLKLLGDLIRFGYYVHKTHIAELMEPLLSMLDGSNDLPERARQKATKSQKRAHFDLEAPRIIPSSFKGVKDLPPMSAEEEFKDHGRYENNRNNAAIMEVKMYALKAMDALFNLVAVIRVQVVMYDYICLHRTDQEGKTFLGRLSATDFKALTALYHASHDPKKAAANNVDDLVGDSDGRLVEHTGTAREYLQRLIKRTASVHRDARIGRGADSKSVPDILIDLCRYEHPSMVLESMNILTMLFSSQDDLLSNATEGLILQHPESVALSDQLHGYVSTLRELSERHIHGEDQNTFRQILTLLADKCHLAEERESPHTMNQRIIVNANVIGIMLNVVKSDYPQESATLEAVFDFLTSLAFKNEEVQTEIFDYLPDMLRCEASDQDIDSHTGIAWVNSMAHCVGEMFNGNRHTCLRVLPAQIERMVEVLAEFTTGAPEMLAALRSVAKLEDLNIPLQRNQDIIMKALTLHRSTVVDAALIDDVSDPKINDSRMQMLRGANVASPLLVRKRTQTMRLGDLGAGDERAPPPISAAEGAALRRYHLNLVELLGACAEGENQLIESMCQTYFTVDELLQVLVDPDIEADYKTPYIKFFLWVYLNTDGVSDQTVDLRDDESKDADRLYAAILLLAKDKLVGLSEKEAHRSVADDVFAFDAFLPFVSKVVSTIYTDVAKVEARSTERLLGVGNLISFFTVAKMPSLYNRVHVKLLASCLNSLSSKLKGAVTSEALEVCRKKLLLQESSMNDSPAVLQYKKAHGSEDLLNRNFNTYVHVLKAVYAGHNDIGHQLRHRIVRGHPRLEHFGDMYCEDAGEDQALPLGREFQAFIELFTEDCPKHKMKMNQHVAQIVKHFNVAKKLAGAMDAEEHERQNEVLVKLLQVTRGILHNERAISAEQENECAYLALQDEAVEHGVVLSVSNLLNSEDDDVVREALALLIQVLEGGNLKAQDAFEDHFLHTREETFFDDIQTRLRRSTESIIEQRTLARQREEEKKRESSMMGTMTMANKIQSREALDASLAADEAAEAAVAAAAAPVETPNITYNVAFSGGFQSASDGTTINPMHAKASYAGTESSVDDDDVHIKDEGNIELVLRTCQLMCEGHNSTLQNYLRTQPDNIRSIDLVAETVRFADTVTAEIDDDNIELVIQTFETLVEFCQGSQGNQAAVFNNHIMDAINRVIREYRNKFRGPLDYTDTPNTKNAGTGDDYKGPPPWEFTETVFQYAKLHLACAQLILSMMDDSDVETQQMALEIDETLDVRTTVRLIDEYQHMWQWSRHDDDLWPEEDEDGEDVPTPFEVGYAWFNVLAQLGDFTGEQYQFHDVGGEKTSSKGYLAFEKEDLTIEIHRHGRLRKIHFPGAEWVEYLRSEVKHELNWHVERTSPTDKIRDFVLRCRTIIADIKYQRDLSARNEVAHILIVRKGEWRKLLLYLTFVINLLMLLFWKANDGDLTTVEPDVPSWFLPMILVLGLLQLTSSILVCLSYSLVNPPWFRELLNGYPATQKRIFGELNEAQVYRTRRSPLYTLSLYHYALVLFSVLGIVYHGYFFAFHLLHIVVDNDILQRVVTAVTRNGSSLLQVSLLMLIIIYIYALVAFAYYRASFDSDEGAFCQTLGQCFLTSVRLGMMSGGGLGEALPLPEVYSFRGPGIRTLFDLSFFILITIIGLNVVFGIIVDTFSELRDEKQQIQEAMNSECFICSRKAHEFDRYGTPFVEHVKKEHHQWNYLYYMLYLQDLDHTDYDSNQQYFADALKNETESAVFPINKARCLAKLEDEDADVAQGQHNILEQLGVLLAKVDKLERSAAMSAEGGDRSRTGTMAAAAVP
mmetsp:Transcript_19552/g.58269  ORF Transcript_19552/g.58269 Transcript_19552/m.58269 type:complete len:2305 (+) Transcript_19552:63-6977(+)